MTPAELQEVRVLVVGMGVSGQSVARYLERNDVRFDVADEGAMSTSNLPATTRMHASLSVASDYDAIVLSPGIPRAHPEIVRALRAGVKVIGDVELFASVVAKPVIAVTGSNGKSTVVSWLSHSLVSAGVDAVACGNIGFGVLDALDQSADVYVLELSSYQLESVTRLAPLAAAVLNVTDDHLDRYESLDAYAAVKRHVYSGAQRRVFNALDARTTPDSDVSHRDAGVRAKVEKASAGRTGQPVCWHFCIGDHQAAKSAANDDSLAPILCREEEAVLDAARLAVPGHHNAANALTVLALAECLDKETDIALDQTRLLQGMVDWQGLPHRTSLVADYHGVRWYDDSKGTNVDACIKAIEAMPGPVVLIAGGIGKGADFSPLRPIAERSVKLAILIGQDRAALSAALKDSTAVHMADSLEEAVSVASSSSDTGDVVLLSPACSSFDMFDNYMARGLAFQEAVFALHEVEAS